MFEFLPEIGDRGESNVMLRCIAEQKLGDVVMFRETVDQQVNVVFPPQPDNVPDKGKYPYPHMKFQSP